MPTVHTLPTKAALPSASACPRLRCPRRRYAAALARCLVASLTSLLALQGQEALSDAEECVRLAPTWVKGYSRKGAALLLHGK